MRHNRLFLLMLYLLCGGCDDDKPLVDGVAPSFAALYGEDRGEPEGKSAHGGCRETPSSFVTLHWDKTHLNSDRFLSEIVLVVENTSKHPVSVVAALRCSGLLNRTASLDLGTHELDVAQSIPIAVNAEQIPIQNLKGASQLLVRLTAAIEHDTGTSRQVFQSTPLYYRHLEGYSKVSIFDRGHLVERRGGLLAGQSVGPLGGRRILGRIKHGDDGFSEVAIEDEPSTKASHSINRTAGGRLVGTAISVGYVDGNGNLVEGRSF